MQTPLLESKGELGQIVVQRMSGGKSAVGEKENSRNALYTPGASMLAASRSSSSFRTSNMPENNPSSPLRRAKIPSSQRTTSSDILSRRAQEAVRMKDEQLIVLQDQNKKLLLTITEMEEEVADAKHKLGEVEVAALRVQDENVSLKASVRRAEDEGRLSAEQHFRQQLEASQHQIKVMAEQNTELLRLLEGEEKKGEDGG